jgi:hypothetical protein
MYFIFTVPYILITRRTVYVRRALIFAVYAVLILLYTLGPLHPTTMQGWYFAEILAWVIRRLLLIGYAPKGLSKFVYSQIPILILPAVALRADMLRRCLLAGIRPLVWSLGSGQHASLVMVSAEAACTESFLEYAHSLVRRQQLDRIVIDEYHLTVTANDYRPCMSQLGLYLRQIRTQTIWLTATLPPALQETFVEHNELVRPRSRGRKDGVV